LNGAFVAPVARLTTDHGHPLFVATLTTVFAGVAAAVVLLALGELGALLRRSDAWVFALLGALGTTVPTLLFFVGTARTSALDAVLCLQVEPVYSLVLAWGVLGHRLTLRRVGSSVLLLAGITLAVSGQSGADPLGLGLLLATPLAWQASHLLVLRRLPDASPQVLTAARYIWGAVWLGLAAAGFVAIAGEEIAPPSWAEAQLPLLAVQGVVLSYVGTSLWYQAIKRLDLARATAIVVPSIPLLALLTSFVLLGETASPMQGAGLCLTAIGVLAFVMSPHAVEAVERVPTQMAPIAAPAGDEAGGDQA
jgi:drug/metabolite transporter (DMT)-like permease